MNITQNKELKMWAGKAMKIWSSHKVVLTFALAALLYSFLAPLWMDPDGVYNLAAAIKGSRSIFSVYEDWHFGPFAYGWGPFYSWLLLLVHPLFKWLGFNAQSILQGWAFNPFNYFIFKWLTKIPFILVGGFILYRMYGLKWAALWLFNPLVIWFVVLSGLNDIYPAFFIILAIYFLAKDRLLLFTIAMAMGLVSKQTINLALPAIILLLVFTKKWGSIKYLVLLFLPDFIFALPYKMCSAAYRYSMSDNFWQRFATHLGLAFSPYYSPSCVYYINIILYTCLIVFLILRRPKLNAANFCLWSAPFYFVYMFSYGQGYERWSLTVLPFLIVASIVFARLVNKNSYLFCWAFSFLPALIQFGWRDRYFHMASESYTLFENTTVPFRIWGLFHRPELSAQNISNYLLSVQTGLIVAYLLIIGYAVFKITDTFKIDSPQDNLARPLTKTKLSVISGGIFMTGLLILLFFSPAYKFSGWEEASYTLGNADSHLTFRLPPGNEFQDFKIQDIQLKGETEGAKIILNGGFEEFSNKDQPADWILSGNAVSLKMISDPRQVKQGLCAVQVGSGSPLGAGGMLIQELSGIGIPVGDTLTVTAWVWANKPDAIKIQIKDQERYYDSDFHPGDGRFHKLAVSCPIGLASGRIEVILWVHPGRHIAVFDDVKAYVSDIAFTAQRINLYPVSYLDDVAGSIYTVRYKYKTKMGIRDIFLGKVSRP
jgi:hypothetical protein